MGKLRILVLRPEPDAARSAAVLTKSGHDPVIAPLFTVMATGNARPDGPFDAIVITSANAVAPLLANSPPDWRGVPLFAVGQRSATVARKAGFARVHSADGTRDELIMLVRARLKPGARVLLVLGYDHKDDLVPRLAQAGLQPVLWTAYEARSVAALPDIARTALEAGDLDAVLHYSRRGAQVFIALARDAGCWAAATGLAHYVLSQDVAAPLQASGVPHLVIAAQPGESALLQCLPGIKARNWPASGDNLEMRPDQRLASETGPTTGDSMSAGENDRGSNPAGQSSARAGRGRRPSVVIEGDMIHAAAPEVPLSEAQVAETPPEAATPEIAETAIAPESATHSEKPAVPASRQFGALAIVGAGLLGGLLGTGATLVLPRLIPSLDVSSSRAADLDIRLTQLQQALDAKIGAAVATAAKVQAESTATAKRLSDLMAAAPSGADAATIAPIAERARRAEALAVNATERLAAREKLLDEAARKVSDLTTRLAAVEQTAKTMGATGSPALNATRLVLTSRIAQSLEAGKPFAADLKALGSDKPDAAWLAPLLAVAEQGAASREALVSEFRRHRPALEQDTVTQSASLGDRVLKVMEGMVSVRPLGEQGGTSPLALTSRIDRALTSGDMAAAATAWKQLPEPARRASESFGARLTARAAALTAVRQLEDETIAALGTAR